MKGVEMQPATSKTTGELLAEYMAEHGFSKRWLSRNTGVCVNTITHIIRSDRSGSIYTWLAMAEAMGCTLDDILEQKGER